MKKILGFAGAIALSVIPTPTFSGELEKKEIMSVTEKLLPQIGEKYYSLDKKEKKVYKKELNKYLKGIEKYSETGVSEGFSGLVKPGKFGPDFPPSTMTCMAWHCTNPPNWGQNMRW